MQNEEKGSHVVLSSLYTCPAIYGVEGGKGGHPALKYQTVAALALSGCTLFANIVSIVYSNEWNTGNTRLDKIHNVSIHLLGCLLSLFTMMIEIEWVQLFRVFSGVRFPLARVLLYCLLAAVSYESKKTFTFYEYISFVAVACLVNAGWYLLVFLHHSAVLAFQKAPSAIL